MVSPLQGRFDLALKNPKVLEAVSLQLQRMEKIQNKTSQWMHGSFSICRPVTLTDLSAIPFSISRPYPFLYVDHSLFYMSTVINFIDLSPPPPPQEYYIRGPFYFAVKKSRFVARCVVHGGWNRGLMSNCNFILRRIFTMLEASAKNLTPRI